MFEITTYGQFKSVLYKFDNEYLQDIMFVIHKDHCPACTHYKETISSVPNVYLINIKVLDHIGFRQEFPVKLDAVPTSIVLNTKDLGYKMFTGSKSLRDVEKELYM